MKTALNKVKLGIVGLLISLFLFVTPVYAISWNGFFQTNFSLDTLVHAALCQIAGPIVGSVTNISCTGVKIPESKDQQPQVVTLAPDANGGLVPMIASVNGVFFDSKPLSTSAYVASLGKEFGVSPAYAQVSGSGSQIIQPVLVLWQVLRNFSYLMFILVFISIGFMIMLKQKLNAQTVLTVQAALPSLVVGLILVTFSYFIAALLVDLSFLGIQVVAQIFASVIIPPGSADAGKVMNSFGDRDSLLNLAQNSNLFYMFTNASGSALSNFKTGDLLTTLGDTQKSLDLTTLISGAKEGNIVGGTLSTAFIGMLIFGLLFFTINLPLLGIVAAGGAVTGAAIVPIAALLLPLILIIAMAIQMIKLFFSLLRAYISILVFTAVGPIIILMSTLPGRGGSLSFWWKTILANSLIFPAVFAVFLFAGMILASGNWSATPPLFGGLSTGFIRILVAYALVLGLPAVPEMVKSALGVKDITGIPEAATGGFMTAFGIGRSGTMKGVQNTEAYRQYQIGKKYREARINRDAQLDRYDEAATLEQRRRAAAQMNGAGGFVNRLYNRAFFRNMPGNEESVFRPAVGNQPIYVNEPHPVTGARMTIEEARQVRAAQAAGQNP